MQLKANEEELNRIFIEIYGLQDELTPDVADKDVTVHRIFDTKDDVPEVHAGQQLCTAPSGTRSSPCSPTPWAVCSGGIRWMWTGWPMLVGNGMTGSTRPSLPDRDGILPITDEEYLEDDIVSRLCDWLKAVYGADTLEENLDFIAGALGGKGQQQPGDHPQLLPQGLLQRPLQDLPEAPDLLAV